MEHRTIHTQDYTQDYTYTIQIQENRGVYWERPVIQIAVYTQINLFKLNKIHREIFMEFC